MNKKYNLIAYSVVFLLGIGVGRFAGTASDDNTPIKESAKVTTADTNLGSKSGVYAEKRSSSPVQHESRNSEIRREAFERERGSAYNVGGIESQLGDGVLADTLDSLKKDQVKKFIRSKFENVPDYEIVEFLQNYVNISDKDIPEGVNAIDFAARLGEIFANGVETPKLAAQGLKPSNVEFGTSTNENLRAAQPTGEFKAADRKIYATFNTENYHQDNVMVKWYRVDNPKVYVFDKYDINSQKNNNYVWLEKKSGWNEGIYGVEIYSLEDNLGLMAYGEYSVVNN